MAQVCNDFCGASGWSIAMKTVNLAYIHLLYNFLFGISDDELGEGFNMENPFDREKFFSEAQKDFQKLGSKTQSKIADAIEYVLSVDEVEKYWRQVMPHDLPIYVTSNKKEYLRTLFRAATGRVPNEDLKNEDVEVVDQLDKDWHPGE